MKLGVFLTYARSTFTVQSATAQMAIVNIYMFPVDFLASVSEFSEKCLLFVYADHRTWFR